MYCFLALIINIVLLCFAQNWSYAGLLLIHVAGTWQLLWLATALQPWETILSLIACFPCVAGPQSLMTALHYDTDEVTFNTYLHEISVLLI